MKSQVLKISGNLSDESIKRTDFDFITDLEFITDDEYEEVLYFSPERNLSDNVAKFLNEFDEIGIINCTDLFTEEASTIIYKYWNKHGVCPIRK